MNRKQLNIGLFGFGCVGYGLYQVLKETPGLKTTIKTIVVKHPGKARAISPGHFSYDRNAILDDPEINVVVELIDDADAAFEIVSRALKNGKAVVTANKKMIAEHFDELLRLQRAYDVPLLYEAACCASIPIIRNLEEYYNNDMLQSIEGIVNGSTNYILDKTSEEHLSYSEALTLAQEKGYAESDPTLDTKGFDAKYKLTILLAHAFGLSVDPSDIVHIGIDRIGELELAYAREKNMKIKLIAHASKNAAGNISAYVLPKFVPEGHKFSSVDGVFNGVIAQTSFADTQFFVGRGAGAYPTASAVLSDLSALTYDYRYEYKKLTGNEQLEHNEHILLKVFFRHDKDVKPAYGHYFDSIEESYTNANHAYVTGYISLKNLAELYRNDEGHSFIQLDHAARIDTKKTKKEESAYAIIE